MEAGIPLVEKGIREPVSALWTNMQKLLDGYRWIPLSTEHDYGEVVRRAREELFAAEIAQIGDLPEF
jgi:hypothetical protein